MSNWTTNMHKLFVLAVSSSRSRLRDKRKLLNASPIIDPKPFATHPLKVGPQIIRRGVRGSSKHHITMTKHATVLVDKKKGGLKAVGKARASPTVGMQSTYTSLFLILCTWVSTIKCHQLALLTKSESFIYASELFGPNISSIFCTLINCIHHSSNIYSNAKNVNTKHDKPPVHK